MTDDSIKYQVFVSSTFTDLVEERMGVFQTLLDANCIPSGMELFSASPDDQFSYIKKIMDQCDYYVLIVGGRYGSCKDGISYTEKEYEYALEKKIPVLVFIEKSLEDLPSSKKESTEDGMIGYYSFLKRVKGNHLVAFWNDKKDLCLEVLKAISEIKSEKPAVGWIRGNTISPEISKKYIELIDENKELKENLLDINTKAPEGTEDISQGDDIYEIEMVDLKTDENISIFGSWNEILKQFGQEFIKGINNANLKINVEEWVNNEIAYNYDIRYSGITDELINRITNDITVQLFALGIINYSIEPTAVGKLIFWKLTPYGEHKLKQSTAIKKPKLKN